MNVLLVTNGFPPSALGGVEIYTYDLAKCLTQAGHTVTIFSRESNYSLPDYHVSDSIEGGIRVIRIVNDHKKIYSFKDTFIDDKIDDIFEKYLCEITPEIAHFNHLIALSARLPVVAYKHKIPSLVTLHDFWPLCHRVNLIDWQGNICTGPEENGANCSVCVVGGAQKLKLANSLNWLTRLVKSTTSSAMRNRIRQSLPGGYKQLPPLSSSAEIFQERRQLFQQAIQGSQRILTPSHYVKEQFSSNRYECVMEVLPLGINIQTDNVQANKHINRSRNDIVFGSIGSIIPHKGLHTLIRAFTNVPGGNLRLKIFGGEDIVPAYSTEIKKIARQDARISFMGTFDSSNRGDMYKGIDILVVPSIWESYSLVCREALLLGKPVIASRISPLSDVVIDQENGFLFEPGNEEQLKAILKRITEHPEILSHLNCPGPISIPTQTDHIRAIEKIYYEVIDRRQA